MMQIDESRNKIIREEAKRAMGPPSTNLLDHVPQSRSIDEDTEIRRDSLELKTSMVRSALVEKATSMINLILERSVSSSPHKNVGAAPETKTLQGSEKCNVAKRVKIESKDTDNVVIAEEP